MRGTSAAAAISAILMWTATFVMGDVVTPDPIDLKPRGNYTPPAVEAAQGSSVKWTLRPSPELNGDWRIRHSNYVGGSNQFWKPPDNPLNAHAHHYTVVLLPNSPGYLSASLTGELKPPSGGGGGPPPDLRFDATLAADKIEIIQLNQALGKFPKCAGHNVSLSDFVYDTDPHSYKSQVEIKEFQPDMSATPGQHTAILWIAGYEGTEEPVTYEIIPGGQWHPYATIQEFNSAAQQAMSGYENDQDTDIDGNERTEWTLHAYFGASAPAGSVKSQQGNFAVTLGAATTVIYGTSQSYTFTAGPLSVSSSASLQTSNQHSFGASAGGPGDPKAHWLVGYQKIVRISVYQRYYVNDKIMDSGYVDGPSTYGVANHWEVFHSSRCP